MEQKGVNSTVRQNMNWSNQQLSTQKVDESEIKRAVPKMPNEAQAVPRPRPVFSDLFHPRLPCVFQMDLLSPSKVFEESSPCYQRLVSDNHTGLTPGISELQPSRAKRRRKSDASMTDGKEDDNSFFIAMDSPVRQRKLPRSRTESSIQDKKSCDSPFLVPKVPRNLFQSKSAQVPSQSSPLFPSKLMRHQSELRPCKLFSDSLQSPSSPNFDAMMDEIVVSPIEGDGPEGFLRRQKKRNLRRCNSLELRKQFADMSNTPTSSFKRSFSNPLSKDFGEIKESHDEYSTGESQVAAEDHGTKSDHERIKTAVDALQSPSLIADGSRTYCLPIIPGKHSDLKNIYHETLANLLMCPLTSHDHIDKLTIIDCRYPYEYNGGHIKGAINIYTEDAMTDFLDEEIRQPSSADGKHILIFHCEFSSQRGPGLLRHLRNIDRQQNAHQYPQLTFPEIYCVFGGYKEFFHQHPNLCDPSSYTPMADEKYASDLRHFRAKAKSWAAGEKLKALQKF